MRDKQLPLEEISIARKVAEDFSISIMTVIIVAFFTWAIAATFLITISAARNITQREEFSIYSDTFVRYIIHSGSQ